MPDVMAANGDLEMTRGLFLDRFWRWLFKGEYEYIERKVIQILVIAMCLLILSGFIRAMIAHFVQTD
jgi:hypothetical protein